VAGGSFTLTCGHDSTASAPTYQWFDNGGTLIGTQATLTFSPLLESHTGEYSCMIIDQLDGLVGCGVHRVLVQGIELVCVYTQLCMSVSMFLSLSILRLHRGTLISL
jgi:hypothetical protein